MDKPCDTCGAPTRILAPSHDGTGTPRCWDCCQAAKKANRKPRGPKMVKAAIVRTEEGRGLVARGQGKVAASIANDPEALAAELGAGAPAGTNARGGMLFRNGATTTAVYIGRDLADILPAFAFMR